ncbi:hypothetical protein BKA63DRAFT_506121 [Paraphoma chrysanthemicola]|nr:hypothetical protein BKA63DRAFT_506121 [Paraphoma chrysanthemicola]
MLDAQQNMSAANLSCLSPQLSMDLNSIFACFSIAALLQAVVVIAQLVDICIKPSVTVLVWRQWKRESRLQFPEKIPPRTLLCSLIGVGAESDITAPHVTVIVGFRAQDVALAPAVPVHVVFVHPDLMLAHISYGRSCEVALRACSIATYSCSRILNAAK